MSLFQNFVQWFVHNLLAAATSLYITGVSSILVYIYFEPRDQVRHAICIHSFLEKDDRAASQIISNRFGASACLSTQEYAYSYASGSIPAPLKR